MEVSDFLNNFRRQDLTSGQRQRLMMAGREAAGEARELREDEARKIADAERHERVALAARQLGIDAGTVSRAAMMLGDAQAAVDDLSQRLGRAEKKRDAARANMESVSRTMDEAVQAAGGTAVRSGGGVGDLTAERQQSIQAILNGRPAAWTGG